MKSDRTAGTVCLVARDGSSRHIALPRWRALSGLTKVLMLPRLAMLAMLVLPGLPALAAPAPDIDLKLSCSNSTGDGAARVILADNGEIRIRQSQLLAFRWESSLHRRTHGFDCSMDLSDKLELQPLESGWRISPQDAAAARMERGYDTDRGRVCLVNLHKNGDTLHIAPSCPALCGSRLDFAELDVHLPSGRCTYYHPTE